MGVAPALEPPQVSANRYEASVGALPDEAPHRVVTVTGDSVGGLIRQISGALQGAHPAPPLDGEPAAKRPMGVARHSMGSVEACSHYVRPRVGFSCNRDGSRMPLGPHIEFKIIGKCFMMEWLDKEAPLNQTRLLMSCAPAYDPKEGLFIINHNLSDYCCRLRGSCV